MSFTNQTTHYGLPQWIGSDKPTYLVDQNNAYQTIDSELYNANTASGEAVTTAQGAVTTAEGAASTAATALSTAQGAETTANTADGKADNAITLAQSAQTAAGAAQTAAEAAQTAAAGNSITNLANAYDPTQTYNVGDLVTQDGKLYQCITQVSTPEAFDINKWDDKTCSEVFQQKINNTIYALEKTEIAVIESNTFSTYADAFTDISTHISSYIPLQPDEIATDISLGINHVAPNTVNINRIVLKPSDSTVSLAVYTSMTSDNDIKTATIICGSSSDIKTSMITSSTVTFNNLSSSTQSEMISIAYKIYKKI